MHCLPRVPTSPPRVNYSSILEKFVSDTSQSKTAPVKKSVSLSGVVAGNTALCTVGSQGNDLHYRGYDIHDLARQCTFEEVAHLLVHGALPDAATLREYRGLLRSLRALPSAVTQVLEKLPAAAHPMDVLRTGVSALGCALPEKDPATPAQARHVADRLLASTASMLLYWYHFAHHGRQIGRAHV